MAARHSTLLLAWLKDWGSETVVVFLGHHSIRMLLEGWSLEGLRIVGWVHFTTWDGEDSILVRLVAVLVGWRSAHNYKPSGLEADIACEEEDNFVYVSCALEETGWDREGSSGVVNTSEEVFNPTT
jgi:hypothetical protein